MNKRDRILKAIEALPDVEKVEMTSDVPLSNKHMLQLLVYFDNEGGPVPKALGIHASDGVGTEEKLG